jgi:hypothetical protein
MGLTWDETCRRAGGRRRYNARRKAAKFVRRARVLVRLMDFPRPLPWGTQERLAAEFGVSPATIARDMRAIRDAAKGALLR